MSAELLPAEKMVLTVAKAMVGRGEGLPPNIAFVVVEALDRLRALSVAPPTTTPTVEQLTLAQLVMFHDPAMLGLIGTGNEREVAKHWAAVANAAAAITAAARAASVASSAPTPPTGGLGLVPGLPTTESDDDGAGSAPKEPQ